MIFDLVKDFSDAVSAMPADHPRHRVLGPLQEAIRRDIHFIDRHPTTLFQCMWNTCWWYDSPEAAKHYETPLVQHGSVKAFLYNVIGDLLRGAGRLYFMVSRSHQEPSPPRVFEFLERWRSDRERCSPSVPWLRSHRPPPIGLGTAQQAVLRGHKAAVTSLSYSPDGRRIASGSSDGTVRVWDAESSESLVVFRGHEDSVTSVSYSPDGRRVASGSEDCTVRVWDAASGHELFTYREHVAAVTSVSYSPDGRRITSGSRDRTIRIWNAQGEDELVALKEFQYAIRSIVYSPDSSRIVCLTGHGGLLSSYCPFRYLDAENGAELGDFRAAAFPLHKIMSVAFGEDGQRIACGSSNGMIHVVDARTTLWPKVRGYVLGRVRLLSGISAAAVTCVSYCADGSHIACGYDDCTVQVWDAQHDGRLTSALRGHDDEITCVAYSPDGRYIASGSKDTTVRIWDVQSKMNQAALCDHVAFKNKPDVFYVSYIGNGRQIASASSSVRLWDADSGTETAVLQPTSTSVHCVATSPNGWRIACGCGDATVRVWDTRKGTELTVLRGHEGCVRSLSCSADGRYIVSGSDDKTVRVWNVRNGAMLAVLQGHTGSVTTVSCSSDKRQIASFSRGSFGDSAVWVWDLEELAYLPVLRLCEDRASAIAFSPDGRRVACSSGGTVRVWDVQGWKEPPISNSGECTLFKSMPRVLSVSYTADGRCSTRDSRDGTTRRWHALDGVELAVLRGGSGIRNVSFSPDGRRILGDSHGALLEWNVETGELLQAIERTSDGPTRFLFQALSHNQETTIELAAGDTPVAWILGTLTNISTHPHGRSWAGALQDYLSIITLEDAPVPPNCPGGEVNEQ